GRCVTQARRHLMIQVLRASDKGEVKRHEGPSQIWWGGSPNKNPGGHFAFDDRCTWRRRQAASASARHVKRAYIAPCAEVRSLAPPFGRGSARLWPLENVG